MAQNKKSFIAYSDWKDTFDALEDDKAGLLIKHIFSYVNDENPETNDPIIKAAFPNIKNTLKRDLKKWDKQYKQRVDAGKKSAEIRKRNATSVNERSVSSTVSVSDSVSVSVSDSVSDDDVLKNVDTLLEKYKANERLIKAVCESQNLKKVVLFARLEKFNVHLKNQNRFSEKEKEYTRYFLAWLKKQKPTSKSSRGFAL